MHLLRTGIAADLWRKGDNSQKSQHSHYRDPWLFIRYRWFESTSLQRVSNEPRAVGKDAASDRRRAGPRVRIPLPPASNGSQQSRLDHC
jgi:hypothetical protein